MYTVKTPYLFPNWQILVILLLMSCVTCRPTESDEALKQSETPHHSPEVSELQALRFGTSTSGLFPLFTINPQSLKERMRFYENEQLVPGSQLVPGHQQAEERKQSTDLPIGHPPVALDQLQFGSDPHQSLHRSDAVRGAVNVNKREAESITDPKSKPCERRVEFISSDPIVDSLIHLRPPDKSANFEIEDAKDQHVLAKSPLRVNRQMRSPQFYDPFNHHEPYYHHEYYPHRPHSDYHDENYHHYPHFDEYGHHF